MPSKKIEYNCTNCQGSFIRGKSDIEKTLKKNNTVFCSIKCSKNYNNKIQLEKGFSENKTCKRCSLEKPRTNRYFTTHKKRQMVLIAGVKNAEVPIEVKSEEVGIDQ